MMFKDEPLDVISGVAGAPGDADEAYHRTIARCTSRQLGKLGCGL
jgi:hypothetical protein